MLKNTLLTFLILLPITCKGDETLPAEVTPTVEVIESQTTVMPSPIEPNIVTKFFSAEMCESIPKLKTLHEKNPGFHKIILKVEGYPKHKDILVEMKRPLGKSPDTFQRVTSFQIQDDGTYLTEDKESLNYIMGSSRGFLPGERIFVRIRTADDTISKEITGTPNPIVYRDSKGVIALRAEILTTKPTVYLIELPTMKQDEEYDLTSSALGSTTKSHIIHDTDEPLHYSPVTKELGTGGHSTLKIKRKSGEVYSLRMPWGAALDPYLFGNKCYPYHHSIAP